MDAPTGRTTDEYEVRSLTVYKLSSLLEDKQL